MRTRIRISLLVSRMLLVCLASIRSAHADDCSTPTFEKPRTFRVGDGASFVAIGDFNGDGKPDLAVAYRGSYDSISQSYTNGGVDVLLSKGDGSFQTAINYPTGPNPVFVAVGDFNADGKPDLAVANQAFCGNPDCGTNSSLSVLFGQWRWHVG